MYFAVNGVNRPPFTVIHRTQTGGVLFPTFIGECDPPPVQPFVARICAISEARLSLPPSAMDLSTKSLVADQANSPKNVGEDPGAVCCNHFLYRSSSVWCSSSGVKFTKNFTPSTAVPPCLRKPCSYADGSSMKTFGLYPADCIAWAKRASCW